MWHRLRNRPQNQSYLRSSLTGMRVIVSLAALIALLAIGVSATEMSLKTTVAPRIAGSSDVCNKETCPPEDGSTFVLPTGDLLVDNLITIHLACL